MLAFWLVLQSFESPQESRSVDSIGLLVGSLNPSPNSSKRLPMLQLMFGCGSLHLFPSVYSQINSTRNGSHVMQIWGYLICAALGVGWRKEALQKRGVQGKAKHVKFHSLLKTNWNKRHCLFEIGDSCGWAMAYCGEYPEFTTQHHSDFSF